MTKKFAIVLALFVISIVCCAGCIGPGDNEDPEIPDVPDVPDVPVTPVDPVDPVVPVEEYSIMFMLNYGDAGAYTAETVKAGETVSKPATPTRSGYTFKGWFTAAEGGVEYDFTQAVNADVTLYAQWKKKSSSSSGSSHSHSYTSEITTPATCGQAGVKTFTCRCGDSYTEAVPATGQHTSLKVSEEGKIVCAVCETPLVAQIGTTYYSSFATAMDNAAVDNTNTIVLLNTTSGTVTKKVVIDTNNNVTTLNYDNTKLAVDDIKIKQETVTKALSVTFGDEEVVFEVDTNGDYVESGGYLVVAYTKKDSTYTVYTDNGLKQALNINTNIVVNLATDITESVTVVQVADVKRTIDGKNHKLNGVITIDGKSATIRSAGLTIQNVHFEGMTSGNGPDAYVRLGDGTNAMRYVCGVTVKDCVFDGTGMVAVKSYTGGDYDLILNNCTVNAGMHSLLQVKNVSEGLKVIDCKVYSKNGINLNNGNNLDMSGCTFDVLGYAVRFGESANSADDEIFSITKSTLKSACAESDDAVIVFRAGATNSKLILEETVLEGTPKFKGATAATIIIIDGCTVKVIADGLAQSEDENGNDVFTVSSAAGLKHVMDNNLLGSAGSGDQTLIFDKDAEIDMSEYAWTPISVDGYNGADIMTIEGNGATITGLTAPLFAGGFAGGSGIIIKDLTIADSQIVSSNSATGDGAFISSVDSMDTITLINCHLTCSTVTGAGRTGGLIGWTAGYNNVADGPVKTYITIQDCSVIGCEITAPNSVGGLYGHAGNNAWTYSTIKNCIVKDNILTSTDDGEWRVGVVVGTANVGEVTISGITESGNTLTQTGKTAPAGQSNLYGRFDPGTTGKLVIDNTEISV